MDGGISESCYSGYKKDKHVLKEQNFVIRLVKFIFEHYKMVMIVFIPKSILSLDAILAHFLGFVFF